MHGVSVLYKRVNPGLANPLQQVYYNCWRVRRSAWYKWTCKCADMDSLHSEMTLDIPWHVRQYLQKYERCTDDRKLLASMETQIIALRAIGVPSTSPGGTLVFDAPPYLLQARS